MAAIAELRLGRFGGVACAIGLASCQSIVGLDDLEFAGACAPNVARSYREEVLCDAPVAYFRFEETVKTQALNEVSGGVSGEYAGNVTLEQPGSLGDSGGFGARFDGALSNAARVELGDAFDFSGARSFTLEVWLAPRPPSSTDDLYERVLSKRIGGAGYDLELVPDKELLFQRSRDLDDADILNVAPPFGASDGSPSYQHVVVTYAAAELLLYVNGAEVARTSDAMLEIPDTAATFTVASQVADDVPAFDGWLDELAIYDKVLGAERVAGHFAAARR